MTPLKKTVAFIVLLSALFPLFCGCRGNSDIIKTFTEDGGIPTHIVPLYPEIPTDTRVAALLCRYDGTAARIATAPSPAGDMTVVYENTNGTLTYEIAAGGGIVAFFELTMFTDGSAGYALKVVETENGTVHSPFKKTVSADTVKQTRFLYVYGGSVYYLTESASLGRCRIMKYDVWENKLEEFAAFPFTDNAATGGSSCTFISGRGGHLTCGAVDGSRTTLITYVLDTAEIYREKPLPYAAALVYYADLDPMTGLYALYYLSAQGDERIGTITLSEESISDVVTLDENAYVNREEVRISGDRLVWSVQDTTKQDDPYRSFRSFSAGVTGGAKNEIDGCFEILDAGGASYKLCFDKKSGYGKIHLSYIDLDKE